MAGRFTVDAVFRAIDKVSAPVRRMQSRVNRFTRTARAGFRRLNTQVNKFGRGLRTAAIAGTAAMLPLGAAVADVVKTGATFEQTITNAAAKFGILDKNAEGATEQIDSLNKIARELGATTEFTASAAAEGLNFLAFAGFTAEQSIAALPGLVDLATAAQIELGEASDIATDSLGAFGLATKDPIKQAENLVRISDAMAKTTVTANTNMLQLMDSVSDAAPIFTAGGQSLETFLAIAGTLANAGVKASKAGTQMKNMVTKLVKPSAEGAAVLENLGVKIEDLATGGVRDMLDILQDLDAQLNNRGFVAGSKKRAEVFATIFGVRAFSGVAIAIKAGINNVRDYRTELEKAQGVTKDMAAFMRDTLQGQMKQTASAFESVKLTIFALKDTAINKLMEELTEYLRVLDSVIFANKETSITFIDGLMQSVLSLIRVFGLLLGVFLAFKLSMIAIVVTGAVLTFGVKLMTGAVILFNAAIKAARIAVAIFNVIFALSPFGAIAAAIGLVIAAIVLLALNWDKVVASISAGIEFVIGGVRKLVGPFADLLGGVDKLISSGKILFGFEDPPAREGAPAGPVVVTPASRTAAAVSESRETSTADVTIRPADGTEAEVTAGKVGPGITLLPSGAF